MAEFTQAPDALLPTAVAAKESPPAPPKPAHKSRCRTPFALWATLYLVAMTGLPVLGSTLVLRALWGLGWAGQVVACLLAPLLYVVLVVLVAGSLSRPHQHAIRPGRFPRDLNDPTYRARRLYGLSWTFIYYFTPLYWVVLALPWLKRLTFRLFGYRGQMQFTVYPDTWIRDLPLLDFGPGAYVSNKATLGTNVAQRNGLLLVDHIVVGARALVGHLAMLSTGTVLEEGAEVGVGCAVGSKVTFRKGSSVSACCAVGHLADIGEGTDVGYASSIGIAARVGPGLHLPQVTIVPNRARVGTEAEVAALLSSALSPVARLAAQMRLEAPLEPPQDLRWNRFE